MKTEPVILYLMNGVEIIGRIRSETEDEIVLDDALEIDMTHNEEGIPVFYFRKYCMYVDHFIVSFPKKVVVNQFHSPLQAIVQNYETTVSKFNKLQERMKTYMENSEVVMSDEDEDEDTNPLTSPMVH